MKTLALIALGLAAIAFILGGIVAVEPIQTIVVGSEGWLGTCTVLLLASIALSQLEMLKGSGKK